MGLSKTHLDGNTRETRFDPADLARLLREAVPEAEFCLLLGSSAAGQVRAGSDLDLAFYLRGKCTMRFYGAVEQAVRRLLPGVRCDVGVLNEAEPVYRFEALKGRLLFARDRERYIAFFSRTCREYESQMADYARQKRYRREAAHAV